MIKKTAVGGFHSLFYALKLFIKFGPMALTKSMWKKNACKTCALGMGGQKGGMRNELGRFPEVCKKNLQAMSSDMQETIPAKVFKRLSVQELAGLNSKSLEGLGRLPFPLYAGPEDNHFQKLSWDEAFDRIQKRMKSVIDPKRSFFYFSGRSSNEAGFLLQLLARAFGTNHVNNCSYYCHQPSGVGLNKGIGSGTATVSLADVEHGDLFLLFGANPTSNHPRLLSSLHNMKKKGGRVIVVNPVVEPGLVRFKIPSHIWSLFFGTKIADKYVQPHIGGDLALIAGVSKCLLDGNHFDDAFVEKATEGFAEFKEYINSLSWPKILDGAGVGRDEIEDIALMIRESKKVIFSWAMGITHHIHGVDNVSALVNLALLTGMVGKPHSGLLPLRGHSNVQGMGSVGVTPQLKETVFEKLESQGVKMPSHRGYDTMACMEAAHRGEMEFAWCLGGNLYESNPDLRYAHEALSNVGMTVYLNTTLNKGHLLGRGQETIILPVLARDEESQSTTQESMFSFVRLSDGGAARHSGLKSEVEIISTLAQRLFENGVIPWAELKHHGNIRDMIAKTVPDLEGLAQIEKTGGEFTIPNRIHHEPRFPTPSGKAHFVVPKYNWTGNQGLRLMSVRSEGQFNSVVYEDQDVFRKVDGRDVILMNPQDMEKWNLLPDQKVTVSSETGEIQNIQVKSFDIREGNALMYYPEANPLISRKLDPESRTPGFKSVDIKVY